MTTLTRTAGFNERRLIDARLAGIIYLIIIGFAMFGELLVRGRLIVSGDAAATAAKVTDSPWLFRLGFTTDLAYLLAEVVLVVILCQLFSSVSRPVALVAAAFRLIMLAVFFVALVNLYTGLVILSEAGSRPAFAPGRPEALGLLFLDQYTYLHALGLILFAMNSIAMGYLLARSSHVPTMLGLLLAVAGVGYLISSLLFFLVPGYDGQVAPLLLAPALVAESWFCLLLLRKGGGIREWAEPETRVTAGRGPT
jgi:hypothetical protein